MKKLILLLAIGVALMATGIGCSWGKDKNNVASGSSGVVPQAPENLIALAISQTQIDLIWQDNSNNESGFKVERKLGATGTYLEIAQVTANIASYSDLNLSASTAYYYQVRASNSYGDSGWSNEASATTLPFPPSAPSVLAITAITVTSVALSWVDGSDNEDRFVIERKTSASSYTAIADVNANAVNFTDNSVSPFTEYQYRVKAVNLGGDSSYSNEVSGMTPLRIVSIDTFEDTLYDCPIIAVDSQGKIHIAYGVKIAGLYYLKYANNTSDTWESQTIDVGEIWIGYISIVADVNDKIHISYIDADPNPINGSQSDSMLKYANNSLGAWVIEIVDRDDAVPAFTDSKVDGEISIALDSNNRVHISYNDNVADDLKYATNAFGGWVISVVDSAGEVGDHSSLKVGSDNKVRIAYYDWSYGDLKYATNESGSWVITVVDSQYTTGIEPELALDKNNKAHISFQARYGVDLKYATNSSGSWIVTEVIRDDAAPPSMALDSNDKAHINFTDSNTKLYYVTNVSGSWRVYLADNPSDRWLGKYTSIALDRDGKMHMSYMYRPSFWSSNYELIYATNK